MDTTKFNKTSREEYKKQTRKNWNAHPCGSNTVGKRFVNYTKEYFDELERQRYREQGWLRKEIQSFDLRDKEVLEIGYGMGTDHLMLARRGGKMHGISITPNDKKITDKRFEIYGYETETVVGDVEDMPYEKESFDFVYSFGVLHHTPDIEKALSEVYRVMKPGAECYIGIYNKNSVFFWWTVFLWTWLLKGGFLRYTLKQTLSLIEYPNNNPNLMVKLHTRKQAQKIMTAAGFRVNRITINHLNRQSIYMDQWFSDDFIKKYATKCGWYLLIRATKE